MPSWEPARSPDPVVQWIEASTKDGVLILRNTSSALWATVAIGLIYLMCMTMLGPSILNDIDPMTPSQVLTTSLGCFGGSMLAYFGLVRNRIEVNGSEMVVRNPLKTYRTTIASSLKLEPGKLGFPILRNGERSVRLMALEMNALEGIHGGSDNYVVLQRILSCSTDIEDSEKRFESEIRGPDLGLVLLLTAWAVYAIRFVQL